ncbi:MAG: hypothetical protein Q4C10_14655 [Clostridia bacterium]|nr:hypothetical protein [Clostridia bacterium]
MKCGKLTAKLRDAVPVRFYEEGKEIKRYKNIEIPDAIKELEFQDFKFDVPLSGAITFKIFFAPGILPEVWPEPRQRRTRAQIAAEKAQEAAEPQYEEFQLEPVETVQEVIIDAEPDPEATALPEQMEVHFDVEGSACKALAHAIGDSIGTFPSYKAAPSFAYIIGEYTLDRHGVLAGPQNQQLLATLEQDGYRTK